jgi:hypothetical protein
MTDEEKWEEEFEKVWKGKNPQTHPEGCLCVACDWESDSKPIARFWWFESRRRFIAELKKDSKLAGFDIEEWEEEIVDQMKGEKDEYEIKGNRRKIR